ncbi:MFS transporter [Mucilaginibacter gotjawali]|uniref:MFS family permease n=2 Tax=Mucilaginibacter gotjawali TaxID=1550579 RepID=A0A839SHL2_9SPHI|nr:MFS transporter [Mucilaginibacter gotjawali]MBB3057791.1 MFS family permease [Mucilaginibacter gotjawali]BAU52593.1 Inner membrane protein YbjJ [Mucilaginibacter gotjawali]
MNEEAIPSRSPQQYRIGAAIFFFISGFGFSSWASRIPTIQNQLHLNDGQLGTVLFALPIGLMFTMPISNWLLSKYSSRAIMLSGSLFLCVILVLIGLANSMLQLIVVLFFFGSARNMMTLSINTQGVGVQALYSKSIMATFHGIWSMAGFAGAAVGLVMVYFNVAVPYHFLIISILLAVLTLYFINDTLYSKPKPQPRKPVFSLPDRYLLKFSLICFACMACENTMYDWSAIYFQKAVHADKTTSTAAFVIYLVAMTTGRFFGDRVVTRLGIKAVLKFSGIFIFTGLAMAVALPMVATAMVGFILVGFGVSCIVPMVFSLAGKSKNMSSSSALASISTVGYLGFVLVPPLVGFISQNFGLRISFSIIALFGGIVVYLVSKLSDHDEQSAPVVFPGFEE